MTWKNRNEAYTYMLLLNKIVSQYSGSGVKTIVVVVFSFILACLPGKWDKKCDKECSKNCKDGVCDLLNGDCINGCLGPNCTHSKCLHFRFPRYSVQVRASVPCDIVCFCLNWKQWNVKFMRCSVYLLFVHLLTKVEFYLKYIR